MRLIVGGGYIVLATVACLAMAFQVWALEDLPRAAALGIVIALPALFLIADRIGGKCPRCGSAVTPVRAAKQAGHERQ